MNLDRVTFHLECVFLALESYSELATKRGLIDLALIENSYKNGMFLSFEHTLRLSRTSPGS